MAGGARTRAEFREKRMGQGTIPLKIPINMSTAYKEQVQIKFLKIQSPWSDLVKERAGKREIQLRGHH